MKDKSSNLNDTILHLDTHIVAQNQIIDNLRRENERLKFIIRRLIFSKILKLWVK